MSHLPRILSCGFLLAVSALAASATPVQLECQVDRQGRFWGFREGVGWVEGWCPVATPPPVRGPIQPVAPLSGRPAAEPLKPVAPQSGKRPAEPLRPVQPMQGVRSF